MKKNLLIMSLFILFVSPALAELTVEDTTSPEFMKNSGYSKASINATQKIIARNNGEALEEPVEHEIYNYTPVKFIRRLFMYIDPSLDDHSFMNDHNINTSPRFDDL